MTNTFEKLDLQTPDYTNENIAKLAELFPNCVTEKKNEKGELEKAIDFDVLRQEFSSSIVEGQAERYSLNWPGKRKALVAANTPIKKTLRPCRDESVDFDNTKNIFIEGDNLDALKLLQETYLGKVKMIYIDPPYNTGNDFIYNDSFTAEKVEYEEASGQRQTDGGRLVANQESNGRFHSDWLSMIYPRLKLARNLLRDDGVIFISIDDNEQANLKRVCDEVFGEDNLIANTIRVSNSAKNNVNQISVTHEYSLIYCKNKEFISKNWSVPKGQVSEFESYAKRLLKEGLTSEEIEKELRILTKYPRFYEFDHFYYCDSKGVYQTDNPGGVKDGNKTSVIYHPITKKVCNKPDGGWRYKEDKIREIEAQNKWHFGQDENTIPRLKRYLRECLSSKPTSLHFFDSQTDAKMLKKMELPFDFPKPRDYIAYLLRMDNSNNNTILDFFAGSGTTAHAVMQLNAEDGGNRKFISVQLPEATDEKSEAYKAGYKNIAEISKERIRRAGKKIKEDNAGKEGIENLDVGFRVFKIDSSNMEDVHLTPDETRLELFDALEGNIKKDRTPEDLLFQVLLDWGVDLSLPIECKNIDGKQMFFVDDNALAACFDEGINEDFVKQLAERQPLRVVFRDDGFANDAVKINIEQIFKLKSPVTEIKVI